MLTASNDKTRVSVNAAAATACGLALALGVGAFVATDGSTLGPNTWTEIALVAAAAALGGWVLVAGAPGRAWGLGTLALFACLAVLTAVSIAWSVAPDTSWTEAGRTLGYLACFAAAVALARLLPNRWPAVLAAIALAAVAISGWALLVKAFGWSFDQQPQYGRLLAPFGYWNATGVVAALGLPAAIWAAARRAASRLEVAAATAAITLLITVVVLTYSRSAALAAVAGVGTVLALGEVRLRSVRALAIGGAGAAGICIWALGDTALTGNPGNGVAHAARLHAGHTFGIALVIVLIAVAGVAYAVASASERVQLPQELRRRIGMALIGLLALLPVLAAIALAVSSRGFTGQISHIWHTLTSSSGSVGDTAGRLADVANSRPAYWHQAWSVADHHLVAGAGAGGFGVAHLEYPTRTLLPNTATVPTTHAHSYVMQTLADLGLVGLALNLALLLAWGATVRRALSRRGAGDEAAGRSRSGAERDGLVALLGVVAAYGVSSAIDWTWFFPGVTLPALVCAGWLAGRGPLAAPVGLRPRGSRALLARPRAILAVTALIVASFALAYGVWQPLRSADADGAALAAEAGGQLGAALADAHDAVSDFPVSLTALQYLSDLQSAAGERAQAEATLVQATREQPDNPASWLALGDYRSLVLHRYYEAALAYDHAAELYYADQAVDTLVTNAVAKSRKR